MAICSNATRQQEQGFTLVELAIVLVIIGLIVGGVLVGQDLIKAASIRATISQKEKYDTAVNTFRGKYNGFPGDLSNAATFGLASNGQGSTTGLGNGNGLIEGSCSTPTGGGGENFIFWTHLGQASMIPEPTTSIMTYVCNAAAVPIDDTVLPLAKIGKGSRWAVTSVGGLNYFMLAGITTSAITTGIYTGATNSVVNIDAYQLDTKLDDGAPNTGLVQSIRSTTPGTVDGGNAGAATGFCYNSSAPAAYQVSTTAFAAEQDCQLQIRASF